jgi:hypothetical protein
VPWIAERGNWVAVPIEHAIKYLKLTGYTAVVPSETVVAVSLTGVPDGNTVTTSGRVTFVIAERGPDWQIVQFHRSPVPNWRGYVLVR